MSSTCTHPLDDITFYSSWLTCGLRLMYPHMHERIMRQFGYMELVPSDSSQSAPPAMSRRDMDTMFHDYLNHLV